MNALQLVILRVGQSPRGTFGALTCKGIPFALTLEPPWKDNQHNISCIPAGRYVCQSVQSPKFGLTYEITGVPGRTHIVFHKGNWVTDTEGCVLVGEEFGGTFDAPMLKSSDRGFWEFMAATLGRPSFVLDIVEAPLPTAEEPVTV